MVENWLLIMNRMFENVNRIKRACRILEIIMYWESVKFMDSEQKKS